MAPAFINAQKENANEIRRSLEKEGVVVIEGLVSAEALDGMRAAFAARLLNLNWNDRDGYVKTTRFRHGVRDVLTMHQGFVDIAVHPLILEVVREYIGSSFQLAEAKGWRSLATRKDFHGWHHDRWYDEQAVPEPPREVKLATYLSDVETGGFAYVPGSHNREAMSANRQVDYEKADYDTAEVITGAAGTSILFDTAGVHRQSHPILEPRDAIFYNYHDAGWPVQKEDQKSYRYHPLLLNAAFLGGLDSEAQRVLGFGDKRRLQSTFLRDPHHQWLNKASNTIYNVSLLIRDGLGLARQKVAGAKRRIAKRS